MSNPLAGGPDFIEALRNAIERRPNGYSLPPPSGGTQVSVRFREERLALLDALSEHSGWNRNQVVEALIDKGLFTFFERASSSAGKRVIETQVETVMKTRRLR